MDPVFTATETFTPALFNASLYCIDLKLKNINTQNTMDTKYIV